MKLISIWNIQLTGGFTKMSERRDAYWTCPWQLQAPVKILEKEVRESADRPANKLPSHNKRCLDLQLLRQNLRVNGGLPRTEMHLWKILFKHLCFPSVNFFFPKTFGCQTVSSSSPSGSNKCLWGCWLHIWLHYSSSGLDFQTWWRLTNVGRLKK